MIKILDTKNLYAKLLTEEDIDDFCNIYANDNKNDKATIKNAFDENGTLNKE